jgi:hypothetical protein
MGTIALLVPGQIVLIAGPAGRYTAAYREWNGRWCGCPGHDHLTRQDALSCAEQRLRYRA